MTDEVRMSVKQLLTAMEDVAEKYMKYSRIANLFSVLEVVLYVSAFVAMVAFATLYLLYDVHWQLAAIGVATLTAAVVTTKLGTHYYHKAIKEVDKLQALAYIVAIVVDPDKAVPMMKEEIVGQELNECKT